MELSVNNAEGRNAAMELAAHDATASAVPAKRVPMNLVSAD
jgi:hypothetical protein